MQQSGLQFNLFVNDFKADIKIIRKIIKKKKKFPTQEFESLQKGFPCIISSLRDFAEFIPLYPNMFDVVVIDEASQVSIAQALPALLRAKKVIVMGDRKLNSINVCMHCLIFIYLSICFLCVYFCYCCLSLICISFFDIFVVRCVYLSK